MQLGARWRMGEAPHRGVPPYLHTAIHEAELQFPTAHSWTLTWLEGRPVTQLDDLVLLTVESDGKLTVRVLATDCHSAIQRDEGDDHGDEGDDDDDWLRTE